jgi:hypothetical protein
MTSTYVNDLRLNEMATGDQSGSWGTVTNTNLELIGEAFGYGSEAITTNADTHTTTIADGATDAGRSMFLKYTGALDSACTITIGPNTVSKMWFIENATTGSQNIIISQGSGANITIAAGQTKVVYSDGAGAGAAFVDAFAALSVVDLLVDDALTVVGATTLATADINGGTIDGAVIGGAAAAAGGFTDITATGNITVTGTVDGRDVAADGTKLDGIEALADVTDATNVTAAGALMDSEVTNLAEVKAFSAADYATAAQGTLATNALPKAGGVLTGQITLTGTAVEDVYAITGTSVALTPSNGSIQTHTLSGATTYTDSFTAGQAITLMIDDGTASTITWPTMTWVNNDAVAPTLATTGYTVVALWKVSTVLYGALVGAGA